MQTNSLEKYKEHLQDFDKLDFNIFKLQNELKARRKVLPVMTLKAVNDLGLLSCNFGKTTIDEAKLDKFLDAIQNNYHE